MLLTIVAHHSCSSLRGERPKRLGLNRRRLFQCAQSSQLPLAHLLKNLEFFCPLTCLSHALSRYALRRFAGIAWLARFDGLLKFRRPSMARYSFVYLLLAYILATLLYGPGQWAAKAQWHGITATKGLLAVVLVLAGASLGRAEASWRTCWPSRLLILSYAAPLISALLVLLGLKLSQLRLADEFELAVALVVSMPVANSTIGWSISHRGNLSQSLGLLAASTLAAPVLAPLTLWLMRACFGLGTAGGLIKGWQTEMSLFLGCWVLLPIALGICLSRLVIIEVQSKLRQVARHSSLPVILVINYINASVVLPNVIDQLPLLFIALIVAGSHLTLSWLFLRGAYGGYVPSDSSSQVSGALGTLMKNTGAALVFVGAHLSDMQALGLTIIVFTIMQHLFVSMVLCRSCRGAQAEPSLSSCQA